MTTLNSKRTFRFHEKIINEKRSLFDTYSKFYSILSEVKTLKGKKLELGSGSGFLKRYIPELITSDVVAYKNIDKIIYAEKLPFKNNSLSAIYMLNVFHHIKNAKKALHEFNRCLMVGGKIIMIEPYKTAWSKFIYINFHHEPFDEYGTWKVNGKGRLSDSNQALPWIIFERDKNIFNEEFPSLKINSIHPHTSMSYALSGGLSKSGLPYSIWKIINKVERENVVLDRLNGMFATIILEKKDITSHK
jgi:SAM-dependent methyltransferase